MSTARITRNTLLLASALLLAGCAGETEPEPSTGADPTPTPATTQTPAVTTTATPTGSSPSPTPATGSPTPPPATPTPAAPAEAAPIELSGSGQSVTDEFTTTTSPLRVAMTHAGSSNFAIWIMDAASGEREELAVNEIGDYDGSRYFSLDPGTYVLDVTADGAWTITIEQPRPASGTAAPAELSGTGDTAVEPLELGQGLRRFAMTHDGSSNFAVWLMDSRGQRVELLANEIGAWEGEKAVGITRAGVHYLDVTADGAWTINVT